MAKNKLNGLALKKALISGANHLLNNKEEVNDLNVFPVPDGDTGTNMSMTIQSAIRQVEEEKDITAGSIAKAASRGSLMGARGNSGVILSQLLRGFSDGIGDRDEITVPIAALAFKKASETTYNAVMKPTEGTILTVAREAADFGLRAQKKYKDVVSFFEHVLEEANRSLENTPNLLPVLAEAGVVDAGGKGLVLLLEGALESLRGNDILCLQDGQEPVKVIKKRETISTDEIIFGYCTEFMIQSDGDIDSLKKKLLPLGDSQLVVGGSGVIKVHLHTNHPGKALEYALELGELKDIKIDNMRFQHEEILLKDELLNLKKKNESEELERENSFVAVSMGKGIEDLFKSLFVDHVVEGGQTMNPSTQDIYEGIEMVKGNRVFILPNNGNIILAAEQACELSDKEVYVIPTKNIPQGVAALLAFNELNSPEENVKNMTAAIQDVVTGQVTYAVRDTEMNGQKICKDDCIGLSGKKILATGNSYNQVCIDLIEDLYHDEVSIITLYYGEQTKIEEVNALQEALEEKYDDLDIEIIYGGDPLYYYIVSLE
ncbi:MAG: DAK2 domain-containing protein [Tissierellia bacterium]|nr:DAK2 domain-containing protein [Tissierellia bacterium]